MNKGAGSTYLFIDKNDRQTFLKTVKEACEFFNVEILAYCLMDTHYHLLVHTPDGNLPRFMRHINGVYTQRRNQRYKTNGSFLKGRYLAIVVDDEEYLLRCARYIHLNPVEAGIASKKESYPWSSHKNYLKNENEGRWLNVKSILERFDPNPRKSIDQYLEFINAGNDVITEQFYQKKKMEGIFGPKDYVDKLKQKHIHEKRIYDFQEIPEARKIKNEQILKLITENVCREFKIDSEQLYKSVRGERNLPKQIAIKLAKELLRITNKTIASLFQIGSYKTVSSHLYRLTINLDENSKLEKQYQRIKARCLR